MTKSQMPRMIHQGRIHIRNLEDGTKLEAEVFPCVSMYSGYPLQVEAVLTGKDGEELGKAQIASPKLNADTATEADVAQLFATIQTKPCSRCGTPAFDPKTVETNRGGLCEACFTNKLDLEFAQDQLRELYKINRRDRKMHSEGMKYRVTAWIHADEGDDDQVDWYFPVRPTPKQIRALLRKEGSEILDDFEITRLYPRPMLRITP